MKSPSLRVVALSCIAATVFLTALATRTSAAASNEVITPTKKQESLIWDIHNPTVTYLEVRVTAGRCIINTVKLMGGQEFRVGAYFDKDQFWKHTFDAPVPIGQVRVNVDKAIGSKLKVTVR